MNVLIFNGSPRGGNSNTMKLTQAFADGAGFTEAEIIGVSERGIKGCTGCFACWNKTPGKCVIDDGMAEILNKKITADVIIWSFPLYYYGVPGDLKNLIDRQIPVSLPFMKEGTESGGHPLRYNLPPQRHVIISTCGFWTGKGNYDAVNAQFSRITGSSNFTAIYCGQGELFRVPQVKTHTDKYLELVRRAGAEFANGSVSEEILSELAEPIFPREMFEKMADASWEVSKV